MRNYSKGVSVYFLVESLLKYQQVRAGYAFRSSGFCIDTWFEKKIIDLRYVWSLENLSQVHF